MTYKLHTLSEVGPPSSRSALKSRFPQHDRSFGIFSRSARVSMHKQLCRLWTGEIVNKDLKLYMKDGRQYGKTVGTKRPMHFRKITNLWVRVK